MEIKKSVLGDEFIILRSKGETSYIQFVSTGYVCRARNSLIAAGKVFDSTKFIEDAKSWEEMDEEFTANSGWVGKIIAKKANKVRITTPTGYRDWETDRKSTRLNSSHSAKSRMPSSA